MAYGCFEQDVSITSIESSHKPRANKPMAERHAQTSHRLSAISHSKKHVT